MIETIYLILFISVPFIFLTLLGIFIGISLQSVFRINKALAYGIGLGLVYVPVGSLIAIFLNGVMLSETIIVTLENFFQSFTKYFLVFYRGLYGTFTLSVFISSLLGLMFYFINKKTLSRTLLLSLVSIFILAGTYFFLLLTHVMNPCRYLVISSFHYYNDHLKSLCVERDDKSECPQNEDQLAAFNKERWQQFSQCSVPTYQFDSQKGVLVFRVKSESVHLESDLTGEHSFVLK